MHKSTALLILLYLCFSSEIASQNFYLKIKGKDSVESKVIDSLKYAKSHKDFQSIQDEIKYVKNRIQLLGYIESTQKAIAKQNDSTYLALFELHKKYKTISIYYEDSLVSKPILKEISNNIHDNYFSIPIANVAFALNYINQKISETGFPFNELTLSKIKKKDSVNLESTLIISKVDQKRHIDKIVVKGYEKFSKSYLKHYLRIKPRKHLNLNDIKNKTQLLQELRFANQIKDPEVLFTKDSTILYLYIEKSKSNTFDGFLGFGTNEETNNIEFNGYLNLELLNNLNYGESLSLIYKSDESEQKTFDIKLNLPYLFGTTLGTTLQLNIFKKDSSFTTTNQNARLFYQINPKHKLALGIKSIQSSNLLDASNTIATINDYQTLFYNVSYEFISRQNQSRLFLTNSLLNVELGTGKRKLQSASSNQIQCILDAFKIFNLNPKNSIFLRTQGFGLFSDTYLENELVRFGGINSIRGFEENSLSASIYTMLNTEYRYLLSNSIYIHSIIDVAYFENKILNQKEKLYGFGFGFGILTKAGLLRFNYANGKSENQNFKLSDSQIHISLTALF